MSKLKKHDFSSVMREAKRAAIAGHIHPDGDCVGACLAFSLFLKEQFPYIKTDVLLGEFSETFQFLKGSDEVLRTCDPEVRYDVFFCLDCGDEGRLGDFAPYFSAAKHTVCIDHHISNLAFADENYIDPQASSTSELICDLIGMDHVTFDMAQALYLGIVHDTGVFQYSCTSPHTMILGAQLMEKGAAFTEIASETFFSRSMTQSRLLGKVLSECREAAGGKILFYFLPEKELKQLGGNVLDLDGISAQMKLVRGTEAVIFMYESEPGTIKVSMRSDKRVDVSRVAVRFGGGGHRQAAGATILGSPDEIAGKLIAAVLEQLEE